MPPRQTRPTHHPGRADPCVLPAADADRHWLRLAVAIAVAIIAVPGLILIALARLQGERR